MDPAADGSLLWIAEAALCAPLPKGWAEYTDAKGNVYFHKQSEGASTWEHPLDEHFRKLYADEKANPSGSMGAAPTSGRLSSEDTRYLDCIRCAEAREWWRSVIGSKQTKVSGMTDALSTWIETQGPSATEAQRLTNAVVERMGKDGDGRISAEEFNVFVEMHMDSAFTVDQLQSTVARIEIQAENEEKQKKADAEAAREAPLLTPGHVQAVAVALGVTLSTNEMGLLPTVVQAAERVLGGEFGWSPTESEAEEEALAGARNLQTLSVIQEYRQLVEDLRSRGVNHDQAVGQTAWLEFRERSGREFWSNMVTGDRSYECPVELLSPQGGQPQPAAGGELDWPPVVDGDGEQDRIAALEQRRKEKEEKRRRKKKKEKKRRERERARLEAEAAIGSGGGRGFPAQEEDSGGGGAALSPTDGGGFDAGFNDDFDDGAGQKDRRSDGLDGLFDEVFSGADAGEMDGGGMGGGGAGGGMGVRHGVKPPPARLPTLGPLGNLPPPGGLPNLGDLGPGPKQPLGGLRSPSDLAAFSADLPSKPSFGAGGGGLGGLGPLGGGGGGGGAMPGGPGPAPGLAPLKPLGGLAALPLPGRGNAEELDAFGSPKMPDP